MPQPMALHEQKRPSNSASSRRGPSKAGSRVSRHTATCSPPVTTSAGSTARDVSGVLSISSHAHARQSAAPSQELEPHEVGVCSTAAAVQKASLQGVPLQRGGKAKVQTNVQTAGRARLKLAPGSSLHAAQTKGLARDLQDIIVTALGCNSSITKEPAEPQHNLGSGSVRQTAALVQRSMLKHGTVKAACSALQPISQPAQALAVECGDVSVGGVCGSCTHQPVPDTAGQCSSHMRKVCRQ